MKNISFQQGHISLNHSGETYFDILSTLPGMSYSLLASLPLTDSMASLILFVSSMSDQSTRGRIFLLFHSPSRSFSNC